MPKTIINPIIKSSPQVVKWVTVSAGADDSHEVGHNLSKHTIIIHCTQGSLKVSIECSPDGFNWYAIPDIENVTLNTNSYAVYLIPLSAGRIRPNIKEVITSPFSLTTFLVSAR